MKKAFSLGRIVAAGAAILLAVYFVYIAARVAEERRRAPAAVQRILSDADPAVLALSERRIAILLGVEDPTFWSNDGVDLVTPGAGLTTISQGLGKRIFFDRYTPGLAKIELMALTRFALASVPKRDILLAFLETAYLGDDASGAINGFPEAARRWFGKELDELSDREFIALVAMLPAPNTLDPVRHPQANAERVRRIERLLVGACRPLGLADVYLEGCADFESAPLPN